MSRPDRGSARELPRSAFQIRTPQSMKPAILTEEVRAKLARVTARSAGVSLRNFPDFFVIGPQRTGTTWIHHNLRSHPEVFLPREKELYYFSTLGMPEHRHYRFPFLEDYLAVMSDSPKERVKKTYDCLRKSRRWYHPKVRGESTASYAILPEEIIAEIARLNPETRAVLMVRDPIDRAWSHARKDFLGAGGGEASALLRNMIDARERSLALYREHVAKWSQYLKPGHLLVGRFDSIAAEPERLLTAIHEFLGVATGPRYFGRHLNARINPAPAAEIPPEARDILRVELERETREYHEVIAQIAETHSPVRSY